VISTVAADHGLRKDYTTWRPNVERAVAQVATFRGRRLKLRYRGVTKNHAWLKRRTAALNLRSLAGLGLTRRDGAWTWPPDQHQYRTPAGRRPARTASRQAAPPAARPGRTTSPCPRAPSAHSLERQTQKIRLKLLAFQQPPRRAFYSHTANGQGGLH
jgi:hypothetical protein